jgi:fluoride exporter
VTGLLLVFAGGAVGAPLRYLADRYVQGRHRLRFPLGTLLVNVFGSFVLGVVAGGSAHLGWSPRVAQLAGMGLCGGFTTFSTFAVEGVDLLEQRLPIRAMVYLAASLVLGVGAAALGWSLT